MGRERGEMHGHSGSCAGLPDAGGGAADVFGIADDEDVELVGLAGEGFREAQGLFAGVASAREDADAVGGDAAEMDFIEIGAGGIGLGDSERQGDEHLGLGVAEGGLGGVEGAHEAGFAGDAAATHDEDVRGGWGQGSGISARRR
jgi:hypothetical protein